VRFEAEPGTEVSGSNAGEAFSISFDKDGLSPDILDEVIAAALLGAADHPDAPVKVHQEAKPKAKG